MNNEQFEAMMNKLEEIRCGLIDIKITEMPDSMTVATGKAIFKAGIRNSFHEKLEQKISFGVCLWGTESIKQTFEDALREL